ncbi:hypothetical protein KUCAC02_026904, partial [Chaenocephalus aceratus]
MDVTYLSWGLGQSAVQSQRPLLAVNSESTALLLQRHVWPILPRECIFLGGGDSNAQVGRVRSAYTSSLTPRNRLSSSFMNLNRVTISQCCETKGIVLFRTDLTPARDGNIEAERI